MRLLRVHGADLDKVVDRAQVTEPRMSEDWFVQRQIPVGDGMLL